MGLPAVLLRSAVLHNDVLVVHQAHALHEIVAELRPSASVMPALSSTEGLTSNRRQLSRPAPLDSANLYRRRPPGGRNPLSAGSIVSV